MSLRMLELTRDAVYFTVFSEPCSGLLKIEGNTRRIALIAKRKYPLVIADARVVSAFAAGDKPLDLTVGKPSVRVDRSKKRLAYDSFVPDGKLTEHRESDIKLLLILHRDAYSYVFPSVSPIVGNTVGKADDTLGDNAKIHIAALAYDVPGLRPPFVGEIEEKVGGHAGVNGRAGRDLVISRAVAPERFVKILVETDLGGISSHAFVAAVDVAVFASRRILCASVPGVPDRFIKHRLG